MGFEPTHPHGRRFSRPNGAVPLSTSKAVYVPLTRILPRRLSGEGPLRPCKAFYAGNESGNASIFIRELAPEADPPGWRAWPASSRPLAAILAMAAVIEFQRLKAKLKELREREHRLSMAFLTVLQVIIGTLPPEQVEDVAEAISDIREQIAENEGLRPTTASCA